MILASGSVAAFLPNSFAKTAPKRVKTLPQKTFKKSYSKVHIPTDYMPTKKKLLQLLKLLNLNSSWKIVTTNNF